MKERLLALDQVTDLIVMLDVTSRTVKWTNHTARSLGLETGHGWLDNTFFEDANHQHPDWLDDVAGGMRRSVELKHGTGPIWQLRANPIRSNGSVDEIAVLGHELDRSHSLAELEHLATHDDVTGLPNRKLFRDRLGQAIARAQRYDECVGVLFLDLDGFKYVNDTMGHDVGDLLLRKIGSRLALAVRGSDTVSRLGGDEFAVALPAIGGPRDAEFVAKKMLDLIEHPFKVQGQTIHITTSVGVATFPRDAEDPTTLVRRADFAMYRAKWKGRGTVCMYEAAMADDKRELLALRRDLHRAIDQGELYLHWQPLIDISTERVVAVEAFVRWNHPEHGEIPPTRILSALDEIHRDLEVQLDIIRLALTEAAKWPNAARVVVNVGPVCLRSFGFVETIRHSLMATGLQASRLELDITGSQVLAEPQVRQRIADLRELGVRISIDDFGTNSLSLRDLRDAPVDVVKIDKSFIREVGTDRQDGLVTLMKLGLSLGVDVVAKGIETENQREFLAVQGCRYMQGWLLVKPMLATPLIDLLGV